MEYDNIDFVRLRSDLENYFGTAIYANPFAVADVINVDSVSDYGLITIALQNGFDLDEYKIDLSR